MKATAQTKVGVVTAITDSRRSPWSSQVFRRIPPSTPKRTPKPPTNTMANRTSSSVAGKVFRTSADTARPV